MRPCATLARAAVLALLFGLIGCTATVHPPATVDEPAEIAILDHGRHATLILTRPDGDLVHYAYGDWQWYALGHTGALDASRALLWPSRSTLGRKELPGPLTMNGLRQHIRTQLTDIVRLTVGRSHVDRLVARLDTLFERSRATLVYNSRFDLDFVQHPQPYSAFHDSNDVVARWLQELGCDVNRPPGPLFFDWRLAPTSP